MTARIIGELASEVVEPNSLVPALLSLVRELRRSIHFYNQRGKRAMAKQALKSACFYLRWARDEMGRNHAKEA